MNRLRPPACRAQECGAAATEYVLLLVFVALVIAAGVGLYGATLGNYFETNANNVANAGASS